MRRIVVCAVLLLIAVLAAARLPAAENEEYGAPAARNEGYAAQAGWGLAAVGCNLLYMPAKVVYAAVGTFTGGLAYVLTLGNQHAVEVIWGPALGGTYVLSPAMVRGEEPILFFGESVE